MRKIIFFIIFLVLFTFSSETIFAMCKYEAKINKCKTAIEAFTGKELNKNIVVGGSLKDFLDFPCIQNGDEARVFQIAADENFSKIDKDMDKFLEDLYDSKGFYFSEENSYFEGLEQIFLQRDEFKKRYNAACVTSLMETAQCVNDGEKNAVSVLGAINFIHGAEGGGACFSLGETKVNIFLEIAYNGLVLNSTQVFHDKHKLYTQDEREAYGRLMESMRINQAYIERLNSKWTSKTKNVYK